MAKYLLVFFAFLVSLGGISQTTYKTKTFKIGKQSVFEPEKVKPEFNPSIKNIEAPKPDGEGYKDFLLRQKIKSKAQFPRTGETTFSEKTRKTQAAAPIVEKGFPLTESRFDGLIYGPFTGGIPNDDALAVSNGGIVLAGINSVIYAYDTQTDTAMFDDHLIGLGTIGREANGVSGGRFYDPKLLYDEAEDRFILVFLRDNDSINSRIMVAFSTTNNPKDPWNVYALPGNPLNSGRWTDFPAISITNGELFITGNLIVPGVSWQIGFDGSVIWQVNKNQGYTGESDIDARLYSDIRFGGRYIRNLHCVTGTESTATDAYFMSNRNFDVTNDTIFLLNITGPADEPETELRINYGLTTPNYGVPPNARQADTDTSDPGSGLQTNDGRVLGAITNGDWIQFVSTTVNPATGLAAIYHGRIDDPWDFSQPQTAEGTILGNDTLDFGYPNLAFTGNEACDDEVLIGFNFSSPTSNPGNAVIYKENHGDFGEFVILKKGETFTDRQQGTAERWGDYFGIQRKYDEPGTVWTSGYYTFVRGAANSGANGTWISKVVTQDSAKLQLVITESGNSDFGDGFLNFTPYGSIEPYTIAVNGDTLQGFTYSGVKSGDTVDIVVSDGYGCQITRKVVAEKSANSNSGVFPNPAQARIISQFELPQSGTIQVMIADMRGNVVETLLNVDAKQGLNELQFDLGPLRAGRYVLKVYQNDEEVYTENFIKLKF